MNVLHGSFMDPLLVASEYHLHKGLCALDPVWRSCWGVGVKELLHFAQEVGQSMAGREDLSEQDPL